MLQASESVDWVVVGTEIEALQLEYTWIKEYEPRFNVRYRDDKSYPYLAVTIAEPVPRAFVTRGDKRRGVRYFGPYPQVWAIRESLDLLLRVFPIRTCSDAVFGRAKRSGRACLLGDIGKCSAPCVGRVTSAEHRTMVEEFSQFLAGRPTNQIRRLEQDMAMAVAELDYERAARRRDDLVAIRKVLERTTVVLKDDTFADVVALFEDDLEVAVQVFHVRAGAIRGQRGFVVEKVVELDSADLLESLLVQMYAHLARASGTSSDRLSDQIPREILVQTLPANSEVLALWLGERAGHRVDVRVPVRGAKAALMATVTENARQELARHKIARTGDLTKRGQALAQLQLNLGLAEAPLRIECIDVSNLQGTDVVASLVVFEDGLPRKSEYRRFIIKDVVGQDDVRSIAEVVTRRFRPEADDLAAPSGESARRPPRFAYQPQLLVIDGGRPQVAAGAAALALVGAEDVPIIGLAKRMEEVWLPGSDVPVIMSRSSEGLYLLQRIRDEAHRFAIAFHRQRRSNRMVASALDDVPGLGPKRRTALLSHFGSVAAIRSATADELAHVPGVGPALAQQIMQVLVGEPGGINVSTGEILDP